MKLPRRNFLHLAANAAVLSVAPRFAWAQTYPSRPVRWIVGYPAGGGTDIFVRLLAQPLTERFGQPIVIENRAGAAGNIATEAVVRAPADGHTLLGFDAAAAINATLYDKLNFNFIRDIAVVGMIRGPLVVLVHPSVPAKTFPEFIAYAKANPSKINMASAGNGNPTHLAGELLKAYYALKEQGPFAVRANLQAFRHLAPPDAASALSASTTSTIHNFTNP